MKIERISDEQVKFILSREDLDSHSIKLSDLSYGSEKMHAFLHEILSRAMTECDFRADAATPLIVETIPMPNDVVMVIVTKTASPEYLENKFGLAPKTREERKFNKKAMIDLPLADTSKVADVSIFMFKSLDEIGAAAKRLSGGFKGSNVVYKDRNKYYLVLHNDEGAIRLETYETILQEYGQKYSTSVIIKLHLDEYGEVIVSDPAIDKLASIYG